MEKIKILKKVIDELSVLDSLKSVGSKTEAIRAISVIPDSGKLS
jgi:hypothetical protein